MFPLILHLLLPCTVVLICIFCAAAPRLEGWLSLARQNIRKHGWKRQYVVVSSKKIIFYNTESDKQNSDPELILDLSKLFHVRSVTQGDVIRAEAKDIPRIFQVHYCANKLKSNILQTN